VQHIYWVPSTADVMQRVQQGDDVLRGQGGPSGPVTSGEGRQGLHNKIQNSLIINVLIGQSMRRNLYATSIKQEAQLTQRPAREGGNLKVQVM